MHPNEHEPHTPPAEPVHQPPHRAVDPTASTKSLAIALVVSAVLLVAAAGIVTWLVLTHKTNVASVIHNEPTDDAVGVKNVTFVAPTTLPPTYVKNDQSKTGTTITYYYDDATNCGITTSVLPVPTDKTVKDIVVDAVKAAETQGVTTTKSADGAKYSLKDATSGKTYTFDSVELDQDVKVQGVNFSQQHNVLAYKQFGNQVTSVSYACKAETWADKKAGLAAFVNAFTVKTER